MFGASICQQEANAFWTEETTKRSAQIVTPGRALTNMRRVTLREVALDMACVLASPQCAPQEGHVISPYVAADGGLVQIGFEALLHVFGRERLDEWAHVVYSSGRLVLMSAARGQF